jgi:hypothetical protein
VLVTNWVRVEHVETQVSAEKPVYHLRNSNFQEGTFANKKESNLVNGEEGDGVSGRGFALIISFIHFNEYIQD